MFRSVARARRTLKQEPLELEGFVIARSWRAGRLRSRPICRLFGHRWGPWGSDYVRSCLRGCILEERVLSELGAQRSRRSA
jgi:hypothetical protein